MKVKEKTIALNLQKLNLKMKLPNFTLMLSFFNARTNHTIRLKGYMIQTCYIIGADKLATM